jgi:DNA polymerase III subunit delta'
MGFDDVIGHDRQKRLLLSLLADQKLPQAFLFTGPEGIGKKKVALEVVKHLFCERHSGCGSCRSCVNIEKRAHPDLMFVDKNSAQEAENRKKAARGRQDDSSSGEKVGTTIGIDLVAGNGQKGIKGINQEVCEYPFEAERRAVIIDGAELMTREAANALLKTIEEPPPYNIFFLITSSEGDIPLTIRSRCSRMAFAPLTRDLLRSYFLRSFKGDEDRAQLFSHISYGSIGCGLFWAGEGRLALRRGVAESVSGKNRSFTTAALLSEKTAGSAESVTMFLSYILSLLRDIYVAKSAREEAMFVNRDVRDLIEWEGVDLDWIERAMAKVQETFRIMRYNVNKWLLFESLLLQIMR